MKSIMIVSFSLCLSVYQVFAQTPVTQIEGFLEVYPQFDTTSIYVGKRAGKNMTSSFYNGFFGYRAGENLEVGVQNSFFGSISGQSVITADNNSFFGARSGQSNTTGSGNSFFGALCGLNNIQGNNNCFFGRYSGIYCSGNDNSFFGASAGSSITTGNGNVCIGSNAGPESNASDDLYIDNRRTDKPLIWGEFNFNRVKVNGFLKVGSGSNTPTHALHIEHNGSQNGVTGVKIANSGSNINWWTLYTANSSGNFELYYKNSLKGRFLDSDGSYSKTSDRRLKTNIQPLGDQLSKVLQLQPSRFQFRDKQDAQPSIGFIAQEVREIFPELVESETSESEFLTLKYDNFAVLAIQAIQEQQQIIDRLSAKLNQVETELKSVKKQILFKADPSN